MIQDFMEELDSFVDDKMSGIHTAIPGKILSFDPKTSLAKIQPTMKFKKPSGERIDYPTLSGVPLAYPQTYRQNSTIAFPIKEGDECLVIVCEQSLDYFMYGQETDIDLSHDLSNAMFIPGLFTKANPIMKEACEENAIIIDLKGTRIKIKEKLVRIDSDTVEIHGKNFVVDCPSGIHLN